MNGKGWYSTKTRVNTRASNASAAVVHRPGCFVDSQPDDGDDGGSGGTGVKSLGTVLEPSEEPPFVLVPLRKRPFPRSPTEPASPRKRTHAAQGVHSVGSTGARSQSLSSSGSATITKCDADECDRTGRVASDGDDDKGRHSTGDDSLDQGLGGAQERGRILEASPRDDTLDDSMDNDDDHSEADGSQHDHDNSPDGDDGVDGVDEDGDGDDRDECHAMDFDKHGGSGDDGDGRSRHIDNRRTMQWDDDTSTDSSDGDMPSDAQWKRSPANATATCLRAEERRLQMLCKVHEAVLRQTRAALDGVRFAIRRLERMGDQGA
ncbi:hypothetical protein pneo_cds_632 [Pandoravirus neocaledonia]|uniref:Uncharacterized protein n=1 Tax=Pandoravirus neocaledonia TaxID=2107708 RepID=A0A2U7UCP3_9VIRU|nr:hypothetical protein pneo_cds_632 [Pandoravirus neocaledonia]AVK76239.1 hypothetical protein pneo_cds_632 [Pandoravirus neocaledonia]